MTPADLLGAEHCLPDDPPESLHTPSAPADWADLDHSVSSETDTVPDPAPVAASALERQCERHLAPRPDAGHPRGVSRCGLP